MYAFSQDPDYSVVLGLEEYDDTTQEPHKALIFSQRVNTRPRRKTTADSPVEALALSLDQYGGMDLEAIGRLLGIAAAEVPERLGDLVYEDPSGSWVTSSEYLSGNVRRKLAEAQQAADNEPRFERNVKALETVMPEDLAPEEIRAVLGAPWVSTGDIEQFCLDTLGLRAEVGHEPLTASWKVQAPWNAQYSPACTSDWGTARMNAFRVIEVGLNKGMPVVYDTDPVTDSKTKNIEESLAAQEKLQALQTRFSEWIWEDPERSTRLAARYNELFNSVVPRSYDGSHLSFPGMSEAWAEKVYPWQRDFVWRMAQSRSALCGHPVGAGKTMTEIAGAMTLKRLGLISKAAIVVPNHLLEQITAEAQRLYPGARILMVSRDDLSGDRRRLFAARVATGDYDFVVMTHSGLGAIGVHPSTEQAYLNKRLADYRQALMDADGQSQGGKHSIKRLETAIEKMHQRQEALLDKPRDDGVTFEQLGVSYLIIDEAHLYKNLGLPTNIGGLQVKPAKRATDLEMKLRWLEEHNEGRPFASFFTATPLSNSMVEAYVLQWYLDHDRLTEAHLHTVDAFASTFVEFQTRVEVSPNGASFRLHTRPARFVNVPEFVSMLTQFADLRGPEILDSKRPDKREYIETIEPTDAVQAYVDDLVARTEEIQAGHPRIIEGKYDNMLWVTSHGRAAALDLSLVGIPNEQSPKLVRVADKMAEIHKRWQDEAGFLEGEFKSLQIGFCDLGTPNEEKGDQVYGKLKALLIERGVPAHGIRYVHEATTDSAKARLFQQCRSGEVAVLLGSTAMLGTGTNIQDRCSDVHHIDAPWRPDEVEQRVGRGHRPGNLYPEVGVWRYVQQRTFDAYSWQTLANKAVFFDQLRSGKITSREIGDLGETALSYGQVKAAATGDPLLLEQADLSVTITHLNRLQIAHLRATRRNAQEATHYRAQASGCVSRADTFQAIAQRALHCSDPGFATPRGGRFANRADVGEYIAEHLQSVLNRGGGREWVGRWSESDVHLHVRQEGRYYDVTIGIGNASDRNAIFVTAHQDWLRKDQQWRLAHAIEQVVTNAGDRATHESAQAQRALVQANEYEARTSETFPHAEELRRRMARKAALDEYTTLVAAAKNDQTKADQARTRREELLRDAPPVSETAFVPVARPRPPPPRPQVVPEPPDVVVVTPLLVDVPLVEPMGNLVRVSLFDDIDTNASNGQGGSSKPLVKYVPSNDDTPDHVTTGKGRPASRHRTHRNGTERQAIRDEPGAHEVEDGDPATLFELMGLAGDTDEAPRSTAKKGTGTRRAAPSRKTPDDAHTLELVTQAVLWGS